MNGGVKGLETGEWLRWSFKAETAGTCTAECVLSSSDGARVIVSVNGEYPETSGHQVPSSGKLKIEGLKVPAGECYLELRVLSGSVDVSSVDVVLE
jgi:hypothetical protein